MTGNLFDGCIADPYISYSQKNINVVDVKIIGNTFKNLPMESGSGIEIFGGYNLELRNNIFDNTPLLFRRHGGPDDYVLIEDNIFKGLGKKAAIQRDLGNITYPGHNKITGNTFSGNNTVLLPSN